MSSPVSPSGSELRFRHHNLEGERSQEAPLPPLQFELKALHHELKGRQLHPIVRMEEVLDRRDSQDYKCEACLRKVFSVLNRILTRLVAGR